MNIEKELRSALLEKLSNFQETLPVFRIRQRPVEEVKGDALAFARRFVASYSKIEPRLDVNRLESETIINLPYSARVRVFHKSGAIIVKRNLRPFDKPITDTIDRKILTGRAIDVVKHLGLDRFAMKGERLQFERLWQIKATGMTKSGEQGPVVLCRIVGAFRRYLHDIPVLGQAPAFVKLAGDNIIDSVGIDWRPCYEKPIDYGKVIEPEAAVDSVFREIAPSVPKGTLTTENYTPEMPLTGIFFVAKASGTGIYATSVCGHAQGTRLDHIESSDCHTGN